MPEAGQESAEAAADQSQPQDIATLDFGGASAISGVSAPSLDPPAALKAEEGITAWLNDKRIEAMWCISENRNVWAAVTGVGWKKLANNSDSAIVALTMLAGHARQLNRPVNYREEADGMIREMYVW
jgi:hypothetical protein